MHGGRLHKFWGMVPQRMKQVNAKFLESVFFVLIILAVAAPVYRTSGGAFRIKYSVGLVGKWLLATSFSMKKRNPNHGTFNHKGRAEGRQKALMGSRGGRVESDLSPEAGPAADAAWSQLCERYFLQSLT